MPTLPRYGGGSKRKNQNGLRLVQGLAERRGIRYVVRNQET